MMKVVILAAGYGTRLQRDIENDSTLKYKHLMGIPKPLVPVGGQCLISRWMTTLRELEQAGEIDGVYLVTNHHFVHKFHTWAKQWPTVQILDDGTCSNESRIGAVGDINLCIDKFQIEDDLLIIGGDTLFYRDFDLKSVLGEFYTRNVSEIGGALATCYQCKDSETTKFGILEINEENQVVSFLEKPRPESTQSRWAQNLEKLATEKKELHGRILKLCPCFYLLSRKASQLIPQFLEEKKDAPLQQKDATGHFLKYLQERRTIFVVPLKSGRFDIGNLQSYIECDQYFSDHSL